MTPRLYGLLTDLIREYDHWNNDEGVARSFEPVHDTIEDIREELKPDTKTGSDWEVMSRTDKTFEGHPPGNDFEDEQTIALMNGDDLANYGDNK